MLHGHLQMPSASEAIRDVLSWAEFCYGVFEIIYLFFSTIILL